MTQYVPKYKTETEGVIQNAVWITFVLQLPKRQFSSHLYLCVNNRHSVNQTPLTLSCVWTLKVILNINQAEAYRHHISVF